MAEETYVSMRGDLVPKALKLDVGSLLLLVFSPHIEKLAKDNPRQTLGKCPNSSTPLHWGHLAQSGLWMEAIPKRKY